MEEYCMKCKKCEYGKTAEKYWNKKIKKAKVATVFKTLILTISIATAIINTIILFYK